MTNDDADDLVARLYEQDASDGVMYDAMKQTVLLGHVRVHFDGEKLVVLNPFRGCSCGEDHE